MQKKYASQLLKEGSEEGESPEYIQIVYSIAGIVEWSVLILSVLNIMSTESSMFVWLCVSIAPSGGTHGFYSQCAERYYEFGAERQ